MANLSKTFEQYCCIKGRNVAVEEITDDNGKKLYKCAMYSDCEKCKNKILSHLFRQSDNEKSD